jgi:hypothetical protein
MGKRVRWTDPLPACVCVQSIGDLHNWVPHGYDVYVIGLQVRRMDMNILYSAFAHTPSDRPLGHRAMSTFVCGKTCGLAILVFG